MRAVEDGRGSPNGGAFLDMTKNISAPKSGKYFMKYLKAPYQVLITMQGKL